ncbi:MAG: hypothetical protein OXG81_13730 [Acidobacteria bacterium]|nr:hypothetical protein [Acidobacteriota bacterium]
MRNRRLPDNRETVVKVDCPRYSGRESGPNDEPETYGITGTDPPRSKLLLMEAGSRPPSSGSLAANPVRPSHERTT